MGKKNDTKQIDDISNEFNMNLKQRKLFGKFIEREKADGWYGSLNAKGDFTYTELFQKAKEFLDLFG
jgi:hypothetical protein